MKKDLQHFRAKPIVIILVLIISNLNLNAQHCGWDWFYQNMFDTKGERMIFFDSFEENIRIELNSIRNISTRSKIEIPIVFHIIKNPSDRYIDDGVLLD